MRKFLCVSILLLLCTTLFAQQYKAVWPYEMISGKMIVEVEVGGVKKKAMFDTGASKNTITEELMNELGLKITSTQVVTDVNNKKAEYKKTVLDKLSIPNSKMTFSDFEALVVPSSFAFKCYGDEILIGSEMFANAILTIDDKAKTITITSAEIAPKISLRNSSEFVKSGYMPIISTLLDGASLVTLFDTGYSGFFSLKNKDYIANIGNFRKIAESISEGSVGLAGKAESAVSHRVEIKKMALGASKFIGAVVETSVKPFSLIGTKILQYGVVTIDYSRKRVYFEPYEKETIVENPTNTFSFTVKDEKLVISSVWSNDKNGIKNGDVVTHINGKRTPKMDFCISITVGVEELKEKEKTTLTINGKKKISYITKNNKK